MAKVRHWVFDLDDTLYPENDYVHSALQYVGRHVEQMFGDDQFAALLLHLWREGSVDPIAQTWLQCALPDAERASVVAAMRAHAPSITLSVGAQAVLARLRQAGRAYAIVTDGRSITQRAKIAALGCLDAENVSISEEVGLSKLDPERFLAVARAFLPGQFYYVGDNPAKDFVVPKQLGWETIMLDHQGHGVHSQTLPHDVTYHPDRVVTDLVDILPEL